VFTTRAELILNPQRPNLKRTRYHQSSFLIGRVHWYLGEYYRHLFYKETGIKLLAPAYDLHLTILDGRKPLNKTSPVVNTVLSKYKNFQIEYTNDLQIINEFVYLPVKPTVCKQIRSELGFYNYPDNFHITIGRHTMVKGLILP
jgi:hypothetical protein